MDKEKLKFYSIGRGSLNLNGKFYYGLDYAITDFMMDLEQQCKKQKEVIDRILNETKEIRNILNNNRDNNMLSKSCLLSYLEIVEDLLKEVSE